jgi:lysophospholipase L1-like esterase
VPWRRVVSLVVVVGLLGAAGGLAWAALRADDAALPGVPVEATEIDYVALGDSFTAGPLIPMAREDAPGCFRSTNNYPAYLAVLLDVRTYRDASCSGASTADMAGRQSLIFDNRARPQLSALSQSTDLVTVGLGGNDFGLFGSLSGGCGGSWKAAATPCQDRFGASKARDARRIRGTLRAALEEVTQRAPDAEVYVVGYPRLLPESGSCRWAGFTVGDAAWARGIERVFNRSVRRAAEDAGARFVDLHPASLGHDICARDEAWVNGIRTDFGAAAAYHPFLVGMREVARVVYQAVTGEEAPPLEGSAAPPEP